MKQKIGISLILLIITIVVIIILSGSIIHNVSDNNPISQSKEAVIRNDISNLLDKINLYISGQYSTSSTYDIGSMTGNLSEFVSDATNYEDEFEVVKGKLVYKGDDENKINISLEMGAVIPEIVTVSGLTYNKPDIAYLLESKTKAVKWDINNLESQIDLSIAKNDTSWYDYAEKKWANLLTTNGDNNAYWVWIPRYAYKIKYYSDVNKTEMSATKTNYGIIDVKFLAGTTNVAADGTLLTNGYIAHPAFTFGDKELTGIWVAKYEASSSNPSAYCGGGDVTTLQVKVLPGVTSWRDIRTGRAQTVCMNMTSSTGSVGTTTNLDTHQMKNIEWGAVAYLSSSIYGKNSEVSLNTNSSFITGGGTGSLYITNVSQSTTGNVYGIYDISGGAWEHTAAYINNENTYLGTNGTSTYFTNNILKPEYTKYYDIYEPSEEEKTEYLGTVGQKLYNSTSPYDLSEEANNIIRKRLTEGIYSNFSNKKGDALYETSVSGSYKGKFTEGGQSYTVAWLIDTVRTLTQGMQYTAGWNGDYMLVGSTSTTWFYRGGNCSRQY